MKTLSEITNIIAKQIGDIAETLDISEDYKIIVCPERIFVDDYAPAEDEYIKHLDELGSLDYDNPNESPYAKTIFVVIKCGSGQRNMAVINTDATIRILSEENDFDVARTIMESFIATYNFKYLKEYGIVQAYFMPEMDASMEEVYTGFRCLLSSKGFIRVPEPGILFVQDVLVSLDGEKYIRLPFTDFKYNHATQPDPQAFAGNKGNTMALNIQATQTVSFSTYLYVNSNYDELNDEELNDKELNDKELTAFSKAVIAAQSHINKKFNLVLRTNIEDDDDGVQYFGSDDQKLIPLVDAWFILTDVSYAQDLGDLSPFSLSFTRALKEEL